MIRHYHLLIVIIVSSTHLFSQEKIFYPPYYFVPDQAYIIDTTSGNLNKDAFNDMIMIIGNKADTTLDEFDRTLLLLEGNGKGKYSIINQSDKVVMCRVCGGAMGDPYAATVIKNGYFTIEHYGGSSWRWTRYTTFKYDPLIKNFRLHKDGGTSFHASEPAKEKESFYNEKQYGKMLFEDFEYEN